jgi:hypothetical protein
MKDSKRIWVWVGTVVVIIVAVVWIIWAVRKPSAPPPAGPTPVFAPKGQLTPQFPKTLILDSNAGISGSYSVNYSSSTNQYTAQYDSSSTVTSLYNAYHSYFSENNWTLSGSVTTHPAFDALAATQSGAQATVVISMKNGGGSQVTVTYVGQ